MQTSKVQMFSLVNMIQLSLTLVIIRKQKKMELSNIDKAHTTTKAGAFCRRHEGNLDIEDGAP